MEINLLPKKEPKFQFAWFFWGLSVLSIVFATGLFWRMHTQLVQEQSDLQQKYTQLTQQQSLLLAQRNVADPRFQKLKQFQDEIAKLKKGQTDWEARLNDLASHMPKAAVIHSISYQAPDISIDGQIDSLKTAAQFSEALKKLNWVLDVSLTTVSNAGKDNAQQGNAAAGNISQANAYSQTLRDTFHMTIQTKDIATNDQLKGAQK
ncbi:PilN domain-containing protein [Fodinisporobacter ferrooxydans]|uniref:PilN domain-containing protein n=1 Tax=Fodinisporobacter ferrooxydans TaxID=2901836 RepID=A0ABY4CL22_9BACL|nr:PilN domain-containing protein [Alicyclobacillaceae bacterium MYW30-H2]